MDVVGGAGHQVAGLSLGVEGLALAQKRLEQLGPGIALDALGQELEARVAADAGQALDQRRQDDGAGYQQQVARHPVRPGEDVEAAADQYLDRRIAEVVGDGKGHIGVGLGKAKETLPARDKALRKAKLGIIKVNRACSSFDCACGEPHTVPFKVTGKSASVRVTLIPAPQGTGLVVGNELKKILTLTGIKDVYSKSFGQRRTTFNLIKAGINALFETNASRGENKK